MAKPSEAACRLRASQLRSVAALTPNPAARIKYERLADRYERSLTRTLADAASDRAATQQSDAQAV